jgi:hypothetical protein
MDIAGWSSALSLADLEEGEGRKDMARVRNLALLVFKDDVDPSPFFDFETDVFNTLVKFGGVQHLTLVACHYYDGLGHEQSKISLLAPFDVAATCSMYEYWQRQGCRRLIEDEPLGIGHVKICEGVLQNLSQRYNENAGECFELPTIEYAVSATEKTLKRYKELRESCEQGAEIGPNR